MNIQEEAHYVHTLQYFRELVRTHGARQVLEDLKCLDLLTYEELVVQLREGDKRDKKVGVLMKTWHVDKD